MSEKENKRLVRRLFEEALGQGNMALVDELVAPDFVSHSGENATREGFKQGISKLHMMSADLHYVVEDVFAKGARVAIRIRAEGTVEVSLHLSAAMWERYSKLNEPARRTFTTHEIHLFRLKKGKIVEHWLGTWKPNEIATP